MKAERIERGEWYFYIQPSTLLPCSTRDWYFDSDDQRYYDENYFLTREAVNACAQALAPVRAELKGLKERSKDKLLRDQDRKELEAQIGACRFAAESIIADAKKE